MMLFCRKLNTTHVNSQTIRQTNVHVVFIHFNIVSKTIEELRLEWKNTDPVLMAKGLRMPQFEIGNIVPSNCQESFQIGTCACA